MLSVALTLVLHSSDCGSLDQWKEAGLEAFCALIDEVPGSQQVNALATKWSLNEEQARCALEAVKAPRIWNREYNERRSDPGPWNRCVSRWPSVKLFWVGLFAARGEADEFAPQLSEELADELHRLSFASHPSLALRLFKAKPERLREFLKGAEGWRVARMVWAEHPSGVRPDDWEPLAKRFLSVALYGGDLVLAADFWKELAEPTRKALLDAPLQYDDREDLRAALALALVLAGDRAEATSVPLEGDELVADLVRWNLTGQRTIDPWEAAVTIRRRMRRALMRNELRAAFLPFIAPHFGMSDAGAVVDAGFDSGVEGDSAFSRRLRSARARAFLLLQGAVARTAVVKASKPPTEQLREAFFAYYEANGCRPDGVRQAWEDVTVKARDDQPGSWSLSYSPFAKSVLCDNPRTLWFRPPRAITLGGDQHAFIEVAHGSARTDRDASGKWQVNFLEWAIP